MKWFLMIAIAFTTAGCGLNAAGTYVGTETSNGVNLGLGVNGNVNELRMIIDQDGDQITGNWTRRNLGNNVFNNQEGGRMVGFVNGPRVELYLHNSVTGCVDQGSMSFDSDSADGVVSSRTSTTNVPESLGLGSSTTCTSVTNFSSTFRLEKTSN